MKTIQTMSRFRLPFAIVAIILILDPIFISTLPVTQLYTFGQREDQLLPIGDDVSSSEIHLSVPIIYYGNEYSSIFVSAINLFVVKVSIYVLYETL